jgi:DNA-binding CsgD family transcriptional regulator
VPRTFSYDDVRRLIALASSGPAGRTLAERITETLAGVRDLVPHMSADVFALDLQKDTGETLYVTGIPDTDLIDYVTHYRFVDPMGGFILGRPLELVTLSDAASPREVDRTEYSDLLNRHRIRSIAGWSQPIEDGRYVAIGLQRQQGIGDFKPRERQLLGLIMPMLVNACEQHLRVDTPLGRLTPAERAVVDRIIRGRRDRQIAAELGVGFATVRTHIQHAFGKLKVSNRTELVHSVLSTGPLR